MATWSTRQPMRGTGGVPWGSSFRDQDPTGIPWGRRVRGMASSYVSSTKPTPPPPIISQTKQPESDTTTSTTSSSSCSTTTTSGRYNTLIGIILSSNIHWFVIKSPFMFQDRLKKEPFTMKIISILVETHGRLQKKF